MTSSKIYQYILGALITLVFFCVCLFVMKLVIPTSNHDIALMLLGVLSAKFGDVVGFFFGSSKGSEDKTEIISETLNKTNADTPKQ